MRVVVLAPFGDGLTEYEVQSTQRYNERGEIVDDGPFRQFEIDGTFYAEVCVREVAP